MTEHILAQSKEDMDNERTRELNFMMRTGVPIPITGSRAAEIFQTTYYDDFYTISELVERGHIEYVGHQKEYICLRPMTDFRVYVAGDVRELQSGEIVTISLSDGGREEFNTWLAAQ